MLLELADDTNVKDIVNTDEDQNIIWKELDYLEYWTGVKERK